MCPEPVRLPACVWQLPLRKAFSWNTVAEFHLHRLLNTKWSFAGLLIYSRCPNSCSSRSQAVEGTHNLFLWNCLCLHNSLATFMLTTFFKHVIYRCKYKFLLVELLNYVSCFWVVYKILFTTLVLCQCHLVCTLQNYY